MKPSVLFNLTAWLACVQARPFKSDARANDPLIVQLPTGTYQGAVNESAPLVKHWLGVPFAQPPLGDLRFSLPQALPTNASGDGNVVVDASNFGPSCPQYESTTPSVYNKWVREYFIWGETGEDCLTVSIWAPSSPIEEKLPVFIWVYGGGESTGGSSVPYQNPQKWVQRTQAHIVVSVQYRLNFFGFPNGPFANGAANLAFADLRLAMEWTRDNIAAFGGDALRMVLWGQSAGAQLVGQMSIGYPDDPIVTGFIQESGSVWDTSSTSYTDTTHQNFTAIAAAFDCTDAANITACLRAVPEADVEAYIQYYADSGKTPALDYQWLVNNVTTFSNYTTPYLTGHYSPLPKIMASMKMDGASLATLPDIPPYITPPTVAAELAKDLYVRCPLVFESDLRTTLNLTTYRYQYDGNFTNISPLPWMGAYHSSELPMLMGTYDDFRGAGTPFEAQTSQVMQDFYLAFVRDPQDGMSDRGWPKYSDGLVGIFGGADAAGNETPYYSVDKAELNDACIGYHVG